MWIQFFGEIKPSKPLPCKAKAFEIMNMQCLKNQQFRQHTSLACWTKVIQLRLIEEDKAKVNANIIFIQVV